MFDVTMVSVATTLFVEMLLLTMTKLDVMMLELMIVLTMILQVETLDEVKLEVDRFDVLTKLLTLTSPLMSRRVVGLVTPKPIFP